MRGFELIMGTPVTFCLPDVLAQGAETIVGYGIDAGLLALSN